MNKRKQSTLFGMHRKWKCGTNYSEILPLFDRDNEGNNLYFKFVNAFGRSISPEAYTKSDALKLTQQNWKLNEGIEYVSDFISRYPPPTRDNNELVDVES